jgi:hypothetical protein
VFRKIFGIKKDDVLYVNNLGLNNEELSYNRSHCILWICDGMDMQLGWGRRTANKILMGKPLVKCPLRRQKKRWEDDIKVNL